VDRSRQSEDFEAVREHSTIKIAYEELSVKEKLQAENPKIALLLPMTSRGEELWLTLAGTALLTRSYPWLPAGTRMDSVVESPFFINTLPTFLTSVDWEVRAVDTAAWPSSG
jgi:hypothetical protein